LEAEVVLAYGDTKVAEAIAKAVAPDNFKTPIGLQIATLQRDRSVITRVKCQGSVATFIATIDDLLFCVSTAEKAIKTVRELK
jgi:hypothetical protein